MEQTTLKPRRIHYLDWLQVLAVLGVFLYHATLPFGDLFPWHINNAESSLVATIYAALFAFWGMPFFFALAGATSWFSLRRRSPGRYLRERVTRLLVPFIVGSIVLTPIQVYYEFTHKEFMQGVSFIDFVTSPEAYAYYFGEFKPLTLSPRIFGTLGYHLWFVGVLFALALLALPLFAWLKRDHGKRFLAAIARLSERRGGLLVLLLPAVLIRLALRLAVPADDSWADFAFYLWFFISGYILYADERFMHAIRRDRWIHLALGLACTLFFFLELIGVPVFDWLGSPGTPGFYLSWTVIGINAWCWSMFMMYVGKRHLDFNHRWLQYSREASYPFYFIHQPVIVVLAFYIVQWQMAPLIKLSAVAIGAFVLTLGLYELLVRRIHPVRRLFGMKPKGRQEE